MTLDLSKPLGDQIGDGLAILGITPAKASRWLGRPCQCDKYKARLNRLDAYVRARLRNLSLA